MLENKQNRINTTPIDTLEDDWAGQMSLRVDPGESIDEWPTLVNLTAVDNDWSHRNELEIQYSWAIDEMATWMLPVIRTKPIRESATGKHTAADVNVESHMALLISFVKSSGIYALASVALPLITLVLAPFLTH